MVATSTIWRRPVHNIFLLTVQFCVYKQGLCLQDIPLDVQHTIIFGEEGIWNLLFGLTVGAMYLTKTKKSLFSRGIFMGGLILGVSAHEGISTKPIHIWLVSKYPSSSSHSRHRTKPIYLRWMFHEAYSILSVYLCTLFSGSFNLLTRPRWRCSYCTSFPRIKQ